MTEQNRNKTPKGSEYFVGENKPTKEFIISAEFVVNGHDEIQPWMAETTIRSYDVNASGFAEIYRNPELRSKANNGIIAPFVFQLHEGIDNILENEEPNKPDQVLKVVVLGGGAGEDAADIMGYGVEVVVVEPSKEMCKIISKRLQDKTVEMVSQGFNTPRFEVINDTAENYIEVVRDESVEGIYANSFMRHLPPDDTMDLMRKYKKKLKKGGVAAVSLKVGEKNEVVATDDFNDGNLRYSQVYTKARCEAMYIVSGLETAALFTTNHPVTTTWRKWYTFIGRRINGIK